MSSPVGLAVDDDAVEIEKSCSAPTCCAALQARSNARVSEKLLAQL
jgi:hypothetical protein